MYSLPAKRVDCAEDMPANPFDVFSIAELLEQFAYHSKVRRERAGRKVALSEFCELFQVFGCLVRGPTLIIPSAI